MKIKIFHEYLTTIIKCNYPNFHESLPTKTIMMSTDHRNKKTMWYIKSNKFIKSIKRQWNVVLSMQRETKKPPKENNIRRPSNEWFSSYYFTSIKMMSNNIL